MATLGWVTSATMLRVFLIGALLAGSASSCARGAEGGQTGDEGGIEGSTSNGGPTPTPYCLRQESFGPDALGRFYACRAPADPDWSYGDATPPGPYECDCNGTPITVPFAEDCVSALETNCGVDYEGPLPCSSDSSLCWPVDGEAGSWRCQCGEGTALTPQQGASCDETLRRACVDSACSVDDDRCEPASSGGFSCNCGGERIEWPEARRCDVALSTCRAECGSSAGSCELRPDGHRCRCADAADGDADAAERFVSLAESYGFCLHAIELACGTPPAGESCVSDISGDSCTADGSGGWQCEPERPACDPSIGVSFAGRDVGLPQPSPPSVDFASRPYSCAQALESCTRQP
jgi:hypothetical protein